MRLEGRRVTKAIGQLDLFDRKPKTAGPSKSRRPRPTPTPDPLAIFTWQPPNASDLRRLHAAGLLKLGTELLESATP
jgi:hypothetical protein